MGRIEPAKTCASGKIKTERQAMDCASARRRVRLRFDTGTIGRSECSPRCGDGQVGPWISRSDGENFEGSEQEMIFNNLPVPVLADSIAVTTSETARESTIRNRQFRLGRLLQRRKAKPTLAAGNSIYERVAECKDARHK